MLTHTPSHSQQRAVYTPCALSNHRITPSTSAPAGWTRSVPREGAERRAGNEVERLAKVRETRADVDARLRAAADRRSKEREAQLVAKRQAKAKHKRDIREATRETIIAFSQGLEEALLDQYFQAAYLRIAGTTY